jgi:GT2 family glycosyltransferase/glycosyltransferase involved in cell wall biosynthesis
MAPADPQELFGAYYYATGCGIPYQRDAHWINFFAQIAEAIVTRIAPQTLLDAGCALGLLVEQLRLRGVMAEGVDISEFAIASAPEVVRPYVRQASVAEPFGQRYDLIVCIEVLEHMPQPEAERAIANFCAHSDDILFSSSPLDFREATHINVHPSEHWAELFARQGFLRDVDFDASFITPWAVRFRRRSEPLPRLVRDYERRFWELWKETTDLRALSVEQRGQLRAQEEQQQIVSQQHADLAHEVQFVRRQNEMLRSASRLARAHSPLLELIEQLQQQTRSLESELTRYTEHINWLEGLVRSFEHGRIMSLLRRIQRRGPILPPVAAGSTVGQPTPPAPLATPAPPDPAVHYARWIAAHEPDSAALQLQRTAAQQLALRPLISLITPVYNPPEVALRALIASVQAQTYDRWELCLADASTTPSIGAYLKDVAATEPRIRLSTLQQNAGISANSNAACDLAHGEFLLLMDHDDTLAPDALYQVVQTINAHPKADIIYYDEDKISEDGAIRHSPWFKPGAFSPDLLLSTNYFMHGVFRRNLVDAVGRFRPAADGAQDWDLALRCSERTRAIYHIPRILYHWRQVPGSAARDANAKPWALAGQEYALRTHLQRSGLQAEVVRLSPSDLQVVWPTSGRLVSIIIPNRDRAELLRACLTSIVSHTTYPHYEIILVDNGSTDPRTLAYYEELATDERVRLVPFAEPFNWSRANNLGATHARGELLLFLNNDTEVRDGRWLEELVGWAERPEVGLVGCRLVRPDGTTQHAGIVIGVEGHGSHLFDGDVTPAYGPFGSSEWYRNLMAVTGACMIIRRTLFHQLQGFDERYQVGYSDITFGLKVHQQGLRVIYTPRATLLHHEGASRGLNLPVVDVLRATIEMLPQIASGDAYYNPNLSPVQRRPAVADPDGETWQMRMAQIMRLFSLSEHASPQQIGLLAQQLAALRPIRPAVPEAPCRLLLCSHDLSLSGAPLILLALARYLVRQGYAVTIAAPAQGPLGELISAAGVGNLVIPNLYTDATTAALLVREYDVVVVNTVLGRRVVLAAHVMDVPCGWWIHEAQFGRHLVQHEEVARAALHVADSLIFPARATRTLYAELTQRELPEPIAYGVPTPTLVPQRANHAPLSRLNIVVPASIEPRKGQDVFVRALRMLPQTIRQQFDVYFLGKVLDHRFYTQLHQESLELDNLYFAGLMSHEQTLEYLTHADIFVLPSRDEVLPVTLLEAMAHGKAILVTNVGGVSEAVRHGQEAMVVPPDDPEALAADLVTLVSHAELRSRLGAAARVRHEEQFTLERFGAAMEQVVERLQRRRY